MKRGGGMAERVHSALHLVFCVSSNIVTHAVRAYAQRGKIPYSLELWPGLIFSGLGLGRK